MLAVVAAPPAEYRTLVCRHLQLRLRQHGRDRATILFLELARVGRDSAIDGGTERFVDLEQLGEGAAEGTVGDGVKVKVAVAKA